MQLVYTPESSVGAWIKHRRQVLRSTQAEIATLVGCSVVLIRKIETDQRRPSPGIAERLGRALHIAPTETPDFCRALRSGNPGHLSSLTPEKSHSSVSHQAELLPTPLALRAFPQPPHMIETLFGRDREIANICQRLKRGVRLLNLIGAPGIGKTQLALLTAQHMGAFYPQGILFVAGESLQNSQQLIAVLCKLLLHEPGHRRSMEALRKYWQQHPMLLILDSCEHISHIATMISELLRPPSQLQIVTTSQQLLHLVGEHVLPIAPLAVPIASSTAHPMIMEQQASMQLFAEHACAIQPAFALSEHYREITEIVRLLDGIPLALALAARRLRFYTPQQLLTQLRTDLLHELQDGAHDNPYHHQSWKAALDRSMTFLAKPIQNCFYRLSVFVGGWTLAMAEALCPSTDPAAILSMLQTLCDANLVFVDTQTQCEPRFRMLTPIRAYAAHKLSEEAEENIYRLRHAQIMLKIAAKTLSSHVPNNMAGCLQDEYDNLCAAIHWSHKAEQVILFAQFGITLFRG